MLSLADITRPTVILQLLLHCFPIRSTQDDGVHLDWSLRVRFNSESRQIVDSRPRNGLSSVPEAKVRPLKFSFLNHSSQPNTVLVIRTGARTTNLTVILLGAGFSALLVYSLTTELFSKNSPTVLYGDACKRITASPQV